MGTASTISQNLQIEEEAKPSGIMPGPSKQSATSSEGNLSISIVRSGPYQGIPSFTDPYKMRKWVLERMAGAFRVIARKGYLEGTAGHISVRDPVDPETFWINPLGYHFGLIKVSDLVHVNMKGDIIGGNHAAINNAGFHIHSALHEARPDVHAACHFHSIHGKAWSCFGRPLEMLNQDACIFFNDHAVYNMYGGIAFQAEEGIRIAKALGSKRCAILRNHGLLTTGQTIDEAAYLFTLMENSCRVQLLAEAAAANGIPKVLCPDAEAAYNLSQAGPEEMWLEFQPDYQFELVMSKGDFLSDASK